MSIPQTNFENNNRMSELTKNINDIFGYILLYTVIIFTALSALLGGIVVYPIYGLIYIFNKTKAICCTSEAQNEIASEAQNEIASEAQNEIASEAQAEVAEPDKKPIIDENWCNVSVKNIINFESEAESEASNEVATNEIEAAASKIVVEEVLSIRRPSEEELRQFQKEADEAEEDASNAEDASEADASEADASEADASEADASEADASEADDYSPKDKYSIGHYKSKTHIKDPLDFVEY
jgi:hypothetical protein